MTRPFLLLLAGLTACGPRGNALKLTLETTPGRAETCYAVELHDAAGALLAERRVARDENHPTWLIGIARDTSLPASASVRARALIGADCDTASRPNGVSESVDFTFDPKRLLEVTLHLTGGDTDLDGFVSTGNGGADCDDLDATVSPGAHEQCFGVIDHDCNGLASCADPACTNQPCAGAASQLRLATVPTPVRVGDCSGPVTLEVRDAQDRLTNAPRAAVLTPGGPFSFFRDAQCLDRVTSVPLAMHTTFAFTAAQSGTPLLSVASPPLAQDARTVTVLASLPTALHFQGAPVSAVAGQCSGALTLEFLDDAGFPTVTAGPLTVSLSSDAGTNFNLYGDGACTQALSSLPVSAGVINATFHFSGQKVAPFTLRAEAAPLTPAELPALISPGPLATLQFSNPARAITTGTCSDVFAVDAKDAFGNVVVPQQLMISVPGAGASVFTGVTCATPGTSDRFALIATEEGTFTVTVTAGGVTATQQLLVLRPGPQGSTWRWPLAVVTGARAPTGGYQGYTLLTAFDSRGAVDAGQLTASASDLRVHFWADGGWREVDRVIENPNSANTTVRFASQADLPSNATDLRYSFFSGPFDGGAAPADPHAVYLFADDFEEGTLARWTLRSGAWQRVTDRAHGGLGALKYGTEGAGDQFIEAKPALAEADIMFEAWWNTSNAANTNFAQAVRMQPGVVTQYETNQQGNSGWDLAWENAGTWSELVGNRGTTANNTWVRIGLSLSGRDLRMWQDRVQLVPQAGAYQVAAPELGPGNVGFRKWDLGGSIWIDDVTARRYTEPEPSVSVGMPFRTP